MATTTSTENTIRPLSYDEASYVWDLVVPLIDDEQERALDSNLRAAIAEGQMADHAIAEAMREIVKFAFEGDGDESWRRAAREAWSAVFSGSWRAEPERVDPLAMNAAARTAWVASHEPADRGGTAMQATTVLPQVVIENTVDRETGVGRLVLGEAS